VLLGLLVDMKGVVVTSVALGKAHGVLLTNRGHVFTFGPNNKGQSGRNFTGSGGGQTTKERTSLYLYQFIQGDGNFTCLNLIYFNVS